jgi:hypothetical protein
MQNYDLSTPNGQQAFQKWITEIIRKEVNTYVRQVLFERNSTYVDNYNSTGGTLTDSERIKRLEEAIFRR